MRTQLTVDMVISVCSWFALMVLTTETWIRRPVCMCFSILEHFGKKGPHRPVSPPGQHIVVGMVRSIQSAS